MEKSVKIRFASADDAERLLDIYAPYVLKTAVSFEYTAPSAADFRNRVEKTIKEYPYLVAEEDGKIVGFAYAGPFRSREAYRHSAEASIYVADDRRGRGIGRTLYSELEKYLLRQNVFNVYACIVCSERNRDEYLTDASIRFHQSIGFEEDGRHKNCGYKFNRWYDIMWMKKKLCELPQNPDKFIPFDILRTRG